jgi:hypothetical protein
VRGQDRKVLAVTGAAPSVLANHGTSQQALSYAPKGQTLHRPFPTARGSDLGGVLAAGGMREAGEERQETEQ